MTESLKLSCRAAILMRYFWIAWSRKKFQMSKDHYAKLMNLIVLALNWQSRAFFKNAARLRLSAADTMPNNMIWVSKWHRLVQSMKVEWIQLSTIE